MCWKHVGNPPLLALLRSSDVSHAASPTASHFSLVQLCNKEHKKHSHQNLSRFLYTAIIKNGNSYLPLELRCPSSTLPQNSLYAAGPLHAHSRLKIQPHPLFHGSISVTSRHNLSHLAWLA